MRSRHRQLRRDLVRGGIQRDQHAKAQQKRCWLHDRDRSEGKGGWVHRDKAAIGGISPRDIRDPNIYTWSTDHQRTSPEAWQGTVGIRQPVARRSADHLIGVAEERRDM